MEERIAKAKSLGAKHMVEIEEDGKYLFLKEPKKADYQAWFALQKDDVILANETVIRTLAIKEVSDMEIFDDIKSLGSVFGQLSEIMALKKSTLKSL